MIDIDLSYLGHIKYYTIKQNFVIIINFYDFNILYDQPSDSVLILLEITMRYTGVIRGSHL